MSDSSASLSRRDFGKVTAATLAAAVAPRIIASDKSGLRPVVIGEGAYQFRWNDQWAKLPEDVRFGTTHGVAVDREGRVFIHNVSRDAVMIFEPDGTFIKSWGEAFSHGAHGMDIVDEGGEQFMYLCDTTRRIVVKTTLDGEELVTFPMPDVYTELSQYRPTNICQLSDGDIVVGDGYGRSYLHRFTPEGEHVHTWGGRGREAGKLNSPHGLWLDTRGEEPRIVVCDRQNFRLQLFDLEYNSVGMSATGMRRPCHLDMRGDEMVCPDLNSVVTLLDRDYNVLAQLGDSPNLWEQEGWGPNWPQDRLEPGRFVTPHDACFDEEGNIYVAEWLHYGRVTKLERLA